MDCQTSVFCDLWRALFLSRSSGSWCIKWASQLCVCVSWKLVILFFCTYFLTSYKVETWHAHAVWHKDDTHGFFIWKNWQIDHKWITSIPWAARPTWLENAYSRPLFSAGDFWLLKKVRLTWFLACDQGSLLGLCMQDYKSLCAAVIMCSTLVNIQTDVHAHTDSIFTSLYEQLSQLSQKV